MHTEFSQNIKMISMQMTYKKDGKFLEERRLEYFKMFASELSGGYIVLTLPTTMFIQEYAVAPVALF